MAVEMALESRDGVSEFSITDANLIWTYLKDYNDICKIYVKPLYRLSGSAMGRDWEMKIELLEKARKK
jgi:hypothetical protein